MNSEELFTVYNENKEEVEKLQEISAYISIKLRSTLESEDRKIMEFFQKKTKEILMMFFDKEKYQETMDSILNFEQKFLTFPGEDVFENNYSGLDKKTKNDIKAKIKEIKQIMDLMNKTHQEIVSSSLKNDISFKKYKIFIETEGRKELAQMPLLLAIACADEDIYLDVTQGIQDFIEAMGKLFSCLDYNMFPQEKEIIVLEFQETRNSFLGKRNITYTLNNEIKEKIGLSIEKYLSELKEYEPSVIEKVDIDNVISLHEEAMTDKKITPSHLMKLENELYYYLSGTKRKADSRRTKIKEEVEKLTQTIICKIIILAREKFSQQCNRTVDNQIPQHKIENFVDIISKKPEKITYTNTINDILSLAIERHNVTENFIKLIKEELEKITDSFIKKNKELDNDLINLNNNLLKAEEGLIKLFNEIDANPSQIRLLSTVKDLKLELEHSIAYCKKNLPSFMFDDHDMYKYIQKTISIYKDEFKDIFDEKYTTKFDKKFLQDLYLKTKKSFSQTEYEPQYKDIKCYIYVMEDFINETAEKQGICISSLKKECTLIAPESIKASSAHINPESAQSFKNQEKINSSVEVGSLYYKIDEIKEEVKKSTQTIIYEIIELAREKFSQHCNQTVKNQIAPDRMQNFVNKISEEPEKITCINTIIDILSQAIGIDKIPEDFFNRIRVELYEKIDLFLKKNEERMNTIYSLEETAYKIIQEESMKMEIDIETKSAQSSKNQEKIDSSVELEELCNEINKTQEKVKESTQLTIYEIIRLGKEKFSQHSNEKVDDQIFQDKINNLTEIISEESKKITDVEIIKDILSLVIEVDKISEDFIDMIGARLNEIIDSFIKKNKEQRNLLYSLQEKEKKIIEEGTVEVIRKPIEAPGEQTNLEQLQSIESLGPNINSEAQSIEVLVTDINPEAQLSKNYVENDLESNKQIKINDFIGTIVECERNKKRSCQNIILKIIEFTQKELPGYYNKTFNKIPLHEIETCVDSILQEPENINAMSIINKSLAIVEYEIPEDFIHLINIQLGMKIYSFIKEHTEITDIIHIMSKKIDKLLTPSTDVVCESFVESNTIHIHDC